MNESLRRYYLDKMGIQCWQTLVEQPPASEAIHTDTVPRPNIAATAEQLDKPLIPDTPDVTGIGIVQQQVINCIECGLHRTRKQAIAGQGNTSATVMVLLMSPTPDDDAIGKLCAGHAGELLEKMLAAIGIAMNDVYVTSLLKCRVPAGHTISAAEVASCRLHLDRQIEMIKPDYLLVMGDTTSRCLLNRDSTIDQLREATNVVAANRNYGTARMLLTYSPQELLDNPANKRKAWSDLKILQKWLNIKSA